MTETGDGTRQRALLVIGMPMDDNKEQTPPEWKRALNACGHHGGGAGGGAHTVAHAFGAQPEVRGGPLATAACTPSVRKRWASAGPGRSRHGSPGG